MKGAQSSSRLNSSETEPGTLECDVEAVVSESRDDWFAARAARPGAAQRSAAVQRPRQRRGPDEATLDCRRGAALRSTESCATQAGVGLL